MAHVFLVGAGPGDPDLLTVRALKLLQRADVVLHDALVSPEILRLIGPAARVLDIGKRCGQKLLTQDEINALLVHYGAQCDTVVRLQGGDPSIFGRSGEEISALRQAGIDFAIVPGITAAAAAVADAQISLTDRRYASSVIFTTAHRALGGDGVSWNKIALSGATIAIYMPGRDYRALASHLVAAGLPSELPCVVVSAASRSVQQHRFTTLEKLSEASVLPAPSILVVGKCAAREASAMDWASLPAGFAETLRS